MDNFVEFYKDKFGIVVGIVIWSGLIFIMINWKNVVVYEVVDEIGKKVCIFDGLLVFFGIVMFIMKIVWKDGFKVYVVFVMGVRIVVMF